MFEVPKLEAPKLLPDFLDDPYYVAPLSDPRIIARRKNGMRPSPKRLRTGEDDTPEEIEKIRIAHEKRKERNRVKNEKTQIEKQRVEKQKTEKKQPSRLMTTDDIELLKEYYPTEGFGCRSRFNEYVSVHLVNKVRSELNIKTITLGKMYFSGYPLAFIQSLLKIWKRKSKIETRLNTIYSEVRAFNKRNNLFDTPEKAGYITFFVWYHCEANDVQKRNYSANRVPDILVAKTLANYLVDKNIDSEKAVNYIGNEPYNLSKKRAYLAKLFSDIFQEQINL